MSSASNALTGTHPDQQRFLGCLARSINSRTIVECGTWCGETAAQLARQNPLAKVWTADPVKHPKVKLPRNVVYLQQTFEQMLDSHQTLQIDFAYIDASGVDNSDTRLRWDMGQLALQQLRPGGIIAFDDTLDDWDGVEEIRSFCQVNLECWKGLSLYFDPHADLR